ncbi:phenylacetic acid degradation bifunctional protein PaaZ [Mycolicibacterium holsaticum]|uniref:phenylacetic acid degradation bifunctional protein PaaZ n=1 Tax=Mycolicibacterium holsaticum TaxID=152142 RepID=UPI001C7D5EF8|nr:phenylacetic acid degradation bifunctional protein PaaZ [Mycolicibacterium holsaticum]MDA4109357.1 enoyl-CoA hydratase [Mycolicibacterium holsaticum DSM 44478 = JCM 12374]QZA11741.1 phenylacetic acid degradation bifunctional protein PaaZ [Mycolicibacterium holsaticum DSM 44478 = JCM 12374]UNC10772.1 phenylacetic acid degradation bifunctional protein PaaZ [Mycolicibacterium holsaticum DSM 44478 = JCM 12374]
MSRLLESYVCGGWHTAPDSGKPLLSAVDSHEVARISSNGLDLSAVTDYARAVGAPALAQMTFHDRAAALKALGVALTAGKDEFYELSAATGATRRDSAIDIDGGVATLFSYASKTRRELPNDTLYLDGDVEPLGKKGTFCGQHIYTSRRGIALQINAFNFPVWGFLEKLAPAFIAGVPSIVKPATVTAYLTELVFRRIIEAGVLPEGSVQLLCGSARGVLDHLSGLDSVAFTGSADTAAELRSHPRVVAEALRFNAEADSLNASILGPDVSPDDVEFDLFVDQLVTEMTVKAGQKCTAIRRAFVPQGLADAVTEATAERLAGVVVGAPTTAGVTMGPLAGLEQRDEVLKSLRALTKNARIVYGQAEAVDVVGADASRGAFMSPMLLRCDDHGATEPHEVEAFGPVSTVMTYRDSADVVELVARGKGSLVASVVTADRAVARELVLGLAPYHGRVLVLDRDDARESTGHGSPLPVLVHGGPGRAGGGEELGGVRAVLHHMQRTAVQATPDVLTAVGRRWVTGSGRVTDDVHPFRKNLAELALGDTIVGGPRRVTEADISQFADFTGDTFYAHTDAKAAAANPLFGGIVAHGYLVVSLAAGLFVDPAPGPVLANFGVDSLRFLTPVKGGDELTVTLTAKQITPRANADYGEVRWDATVTNQADQPVATYDVLTLVAKPGGTEE